MRNREPIKSYDEAAKFLGNRQALSTGQRGTWVVRLSPTEIAVRYHQTDVVTYYSPAVVDKIAKISNGGHATRTTVARINEFAPVGIEALLRNDCVVIHHHQPHGWLDVSVLDSPYVVPREHSKGLSPQQGMSNSLKGLLERMKKALEEA